MIHIDADKNTPTNRGQRYAHTLLQMLLLHNQRQEHPIIVSAFRVHTQFLATAIRQKAQPNREPCHHADDVTAIRQKAQPNQEPWHHADDVTAIRQKARPNQEPCHHADDVTVITQKARPNQEPCHHADDVTAIRQGQPTHASLHLHMPALYALL
jgi:hypothetical protein